MELELKGKRALVTCAGSGLGAACAAQLAAEGATVVALSRSVPTSRPQYEGEVEGGTVTHLACDITDPSRIRNVMRDVGNVDIVIFVPVRERQDSLTGIGADEYHMTLMRNFFPFLELVQSNLPGMIERKFGRVVSLLGSSTMAPLWDHSLANVGRSAIAVLGSGAAREFSVYNVTFNNIILGIFDTPGLRNLWKARAEEQGISFDDYKGGRLVTIPARTIGNVNQCAYLVTLLASPMMSYMTGQSIRIDGGQHLCV
ncbi:SDR family oxidoreductase [Paraburkholderia phymatum]|uniref:SDR family oxidoreductase n=1 Tax=Paraburkholderia phymatum TaxID=148447 RepID=A0ACC6UDH6_9BURK